jgi:hypothetical protein
MVCGLATSWPEWHCSNLGSPLSIFLQPFILGWTIRYPGRREGKFSLEELFLSLELCQLLFYSVKAVQELFYNFCILHVVAGFFPSLRGDVHIQVATQNIKLTFLWQPTLENVKCDVMNISKLDGVWTLQVSKFITTVLINWIVCETKLPFNISTGLIL